MPLTNETPAASAFAEALEKMAFIIIAPPDGEDLPVPDDYVTASIHFSGSISGELTIAADAALTDMLAANALGREPDDPDIPAKGMDAWKELTNMACGLLLPRLSDPDDLFKISLPEASRVSDAANWQAFVNRPDTVIREAEGYLTAVHLSYRK